MKLGGGEDVRARSEGLLCNDTTIKELMTY